MKIAAGKALVAAHRCSRDRWPPAPVSARSASAASRRCISSARPGRDEQPIGNYPKATSGPTITLGFNVPQTGAYAEEGKDELKAYQLAVQHLNGEGDGGMLSTMTPKALKGNGILGKKVAFVSGDTQTKADVARASAKQMIEKDGAIMITGGSSSAEAIAVQSLCQEMGIIFMAGLTHSNDTTGKDRRRYGFRHFFDAYMSGKALGPILAADYGKDRIAYHLTADYTWGWTQEESMKDATEAQGWKTVAAVRTPLGAPRLLAVHHAGAQLRRRRPDPQPLRRRHGQLADPGGAVRSARQAGQRQAVRDRRAALLRADGAGRRRRDQGHLSAPPTGTGSSTTRRTKAFDQVVRPGLRHAAVAGGADLLRPGAALRQCRARRAGTFYPPAVIKALEGFEFDGMGNGPTEYRAADHQCFKDVLVVQRQGEARPTSSTCSRSSRSCRAPRSSTTRTIRRSIRTARPSSAPMHRPDVPAC